MTETEKVKCLFCKKEIDKERAVWLGTINIYKQKMYGCGCTLEKKPKK